MDTNPVVVDALERSATANRDYGVALSPSETIEMGRREAIAGSLTPILAYLEAHPRIDGGIFLDQRARGRIVVQLVAATESDRRAISELVPAGAEIAFKDVAYTAGELQAAYEHATAALPGLRARGVDVRQIGVAVQRNAIEVGLARLDPEWMDIVRDRVALPSIELVKAEPGGPQYCSMNICLLPDNPQLRAGLRIWTVSGTNVRWCTSGFLVRARQNTSNTLLLTAGHCPFVPGVTGALYRHGTPGGTHDNLGYVAATGYWSGSNADAMMIDIPNYRESNWMYLSNHVSGLGSHTSGTLLCMKGQQTGGAACGQIVSSSWTLTYPDGTIFIQQVKTTIPVKTGDSGGPVYSGSLAHGIVTYGGASESFYSRMSNIQTTLNVDLGVNLTCT